MKPVSELDSEPLGADTFSSAMAGANRYNRWVVDAFSPFVGSSLLEVGVGHGGFRDLLGVPDYVGVDIDPELVERLRRERPDVSWLVADLADPGFLEMLAGRRYETVLCVNVLEHVADHVAGVANLLGALSPGGRLLLFVPAFQALYNDLDRLAGHVRRYRRSEVRSLLSAAGAEVLKADYFNPVGAIGWWLNRFLSHDTLESGSVEGQVRVFDRYVLPISRGVDPVTKGFFGQSVIAVARKT